MDFLHGVRQWETELSSLLSVVEPCTGARPTCSRAGRADDGYSGGNREVIQTSELVTKSERFFRQNPAPLLLNTAPAFKTLSDVVDAASAPAVKMQVEEKMA